MNMSERKATITQTFNAEEGFDLQISDGGSLVHSASNVAPDSPTYILVHGKHASEPLVGPVLDELSKYEAPFSYEHAQAFTHHLLYFLGVDGPISKRRFSIASR